MSRYRLRLFVFTLSIALFGRTAHAQIPAFDAMYVFGDSLADNGNHYITTRLLGLNPPAPPSDSPHMTYFGGRFSNGYVEVEYLWQRLSGNAPDSQNGLKPFLAQPFLPLGPAVDFAFGGTGTPLIDQNPGGLYLPGLKGQVELYRAALPPRRKPKRPLFVIITGSNDYRVDAFNVPLPIDRVVGNIVDAIKTLYRDGARDVMVVNLPNLGLVPAYAGTAPAATQLSLAHNAALKAALNQLHAKNPSLNIVQPDLVALFNQLTENKTVPVLEILSPGSSACLFIGSETCPDIPGPVFNADLGFVFWDILHPTTQAHRDMANYMMSKLAAYYSH
jgi:phospholipase/lecithinase/hemolysin